MEFSWQKGNDLRMELLLHWHKCIRRSAVRTAPLSGSAGKQPFRWSHHWQNSWRSGPLLLLPPGCLGEPDTIHPRRSLRFENGVVYTEIDIQKLLGERRKNTTFQMDQQRRLMRIPFHLSVEDTCTDSAIGTSRRLAPSFTDILHAFW